MTALFTVNYEHVPLVVPNVPSKPSVTPAFEHHVVFVVPPSANFRSYMLNTSIEEALLMLNLNKHLDFRVGKTEAFWPDGIRATQIANNWLQGKPAHTRLRVRFRDKQHAMLFRLSFAH